MHFVTTAQTNAGTAAACGGVLVPMQVYLRRYSKAIFDLLSEVQELLRAYHRSCRRNNGEDVYTVFDDTSG